MTSSLPVLKSDEVREFLRADFEIWQEGSAELLTASRCEGGGEQLRAASLKAYWEGYVAACAILGRLGLFDPCAEAVSRWTPEAIALVDTATRSNGEAYAPNSRIARLFGLKKVLGVLGSSSILAIIDELLSAIKRGALREKNVVDPEKIKMVAIKLMVSAIEEMPVGWQSGTIEKTEISRARRAARKYQGGMILLWLATFALRISNLTSIEQADDKNLRKYEGNWWLLFARSAMKGKKAYDRMVPHDVYEWLETYLNFVRPILCREKYHGDCLWISTRGEHLSVQGIRKTVKALTLKHLYVEITPHCFRDCVATAKARDNPDDLADAAWHLTNDQDVLSATYDHSGPSHARLKLAESLFGAKRLGARKLLGSRRHYLQRVDLVRIDRSFNAAVIEGPVPEAASQKVKASRQRRG